MQQLLKKPEMQVGNFMKLIKSDSAITAASAVLATPAVMVFVDKISGRFSFLSRNVTIALILASFVAFILSGLFSGILQNIVFGISIGLLVNALMTLSPFSNAIGRITNRVKSG